MVTGPCGVTTVTRKGCKEKKSTKTLAQREIGDFHQGNSYSTWFWADGEGLGSVDAAGTSAFEAAEDVEAEAESRGALASEGGRPLRLNDGPGRAGWAGGGG
jgi:hypothetical protein